ncbi:hypothetical protein PT033_03245 [Erysipelothrix rhusiopathiae]|nr:hypothetical protein [Erysipelothrix rhusiopathiae]MDE8049232.1 hypothetical protein [Erysipelothrix rhusiopathiae]MDE8057886.1 hypothetical protein [Erysipelothrix rhusiopathiae]MDE8066661.1 hypothetical protein [Erysipelothrix rhusiopathiae]MDE8076519.1 hypothetical protein [Erysipelothrix rhusiopathiae]
MESIELSGMISYKEEELAFTYKDSRLIIMGEEFFGDEISENITFEAYSFSGQVIYFYGCNRLRYFGSIVYEVDYVVVSNGSNNHDIFDSIKITGGLLNLLHEPFENTFDHFDSSLIDKHKQGCYEFKTKKWEESDIVFDSIINKMKVNVIIGVPRKMPINKRNVNSTHSYIKVKFEQNIDTKDFKYYYLHIVSFLEVIAQKTGMFSNKVELANKNNHYFNKKVYFSEDKTRKITNVRVNFRDYMNEGSIKELEKIFKNCGNESISHKYLLGTQEGSELITPFSMFSCLLSFEYLFAAEHAVKKMEKNDTIEKVKKIIADERKKNDSYLLEKAAVALKHVYKQTLNNKITAIIKNNKLLRDYLYTKYGLDDEGLKIRIKNLVDFRNKFAHGSDAIPAFEGAIDAHDILMDINSYLLLKKYHVTEEIMIKMLTKKRSRNNRGTYIFLD